MYVCVCLYIYPGLWSFKGRLTSFVEGQDLMRVGKLGIRVVALVFKRKKGAERTFGRGPK